MRKLFIFVVFFMMFFCFFGCAAADKTNIFNIKEAYEYGLIDKENLSCLANYYNSIQDNNMLSVDDLDSETIKKIKKAYLNRFIKKDYFFANINDVCIYAFYGIYGDCIAIDIRDTVRVIDVLIYDEYEIDGIVFYNYTIPGLELFYIGELKNDK